MELSAWHYTCSKHAWEQRVQCSAPTSVGFCPKRKGPPCLPTMLCNCCKSAKNLSRCCGVCPLPMPQCLLHPHTSFTSMHGYSQSSFWVIYLAKIGMGNIHQESAAPCCCGKGCLFASAANSVLARTSSASRPSINPWQDATGHARRH